MKKISLLLTMAALALGFTSCDQDRDPVYQAPTNFVLNTPAMQDQYIDLTEKGTLELVTSQPDYGYSAVAVYSAEMSLDPDFSTSYQLPAVSGTTNLAKFTISQNDVAVGLMELQGITGDDADKIFNEIYPNGCDYQQIYFRAVCQLEGVPSSVIKSNIVSYKYLKGFFAIKMPGYIYLVGAPCGWPTPDAGAEATLESWKLYEPKDAIGSKVYSGVFDIPAGSAMFRFYTALTGWDNDSYGSQENDNPIEYPDYTGGSTNIPMVKGKGSFSFPNWPGGKMTIVVDMSDANNMNVTFMAGEQSVVATKYIYLVGSISGWMAPGLDNEAGYANFRLADTDGSGIYRGSFEAPAGHVNFRFALNLTDEGWDNPTQIGSQADDADVASQFVNGVFNGTFVSGKGNWAFELDAPATIDMTVDTNNKTVNYVLH